jgi:DNA repair protein RadA/Sms
VLEHLVDTVLTFEGERHDCLRLLRAVKHRFGPVGELGLWEMTGTGLVGVTDAGALLLADRRPGTPGSVVFASLEGRRPLLVEIQALVAPAAPTGPRRVAAGYATARLTQVLAVLERRAGLPLSGQDVYVSAVGGVTLADTGADLAVAMAVSSAATGRVVAEDLVVLGEVGLGGELRRVAGTARRLADAGRLGFGQVLAPPGSSVPAGVTLRAAGTLEEALDGYLGHLSQPPRLRVVSSGRPG